jgi:hypothetical protein
MRDCGRCLTDRAEALRCDSSPRVRYEIAQYWQRDTIQPNSKPTTAPFIPEGDGVCRYETVNVRRRQPEHDGLTIGRQRGKDLVVNAEIGASKV